MVEQRDKRVQDLSVPRVGDILPQLNAMLDLENQVKRLSVVSLWSKVVQQRYNITTTAVVKKIAGQTVLVGRVDNATQASELSFYVDELRAQLNDFAEQTGVTLEAIRIQVGSLS